VRLQKDTLRQGHRKAIGLDENQTEQRVIPTSQEGAYSRIMERFFTSDRVELLKTTMKKLCL
jgi:hypothetical protein